MEALGGFQERVEDTHHGTASLPVCVSRLLVVVVLVVLVVAFVVFCLLNCSGAGCLFMAGNFGKDAVQVGAAVQNVGGVHAKEVLLHRPRLP